MKKSDWFLICLFLLLFNATAIGIWLGIENTKGVNFALYILFLLIGTISFSFIANAKENSIVYPIFFSAFFSAIFSVLLSEAGFILYFVLIAIHTLCVSTYLSQNKENYSKLGLMLEKKTEIFYLFFLLCILSYYFYNIKGDNIMGLISILFWIFSIISLLFCIVLIIKKWIFDNEKISGFLIFFFVLSLLNSYAYCLVYATTVKDVIPQTINDRSYLFENDTEEGVYTSSFKGNAEKTPKYQLDNEEAVYVSLSQSKFANDVSTSNSEQETVDQEERRLKRELRNKFSSLSKSDTDFIAEYLKERTTNNRAYFGTLSTLNGNIINLILKSRKESYGSISSGDTKIRYSNTGVFYENDIPVDSENTKMSVLRELEKIQTQRQPKTKSQPKIQAKTQTQKSYDVEESPKPKVKSRSKELLGILDMRGKLNRQLNLISIAQDDYSSKMSKYKKEIRVEKQKHNITLYSDITKRIVNNMLLIQEIDAYNTKLSELKKVTKSGLEESVYMERRLNLKENMVSVTGSTKSLGKDIEKLLKKYDSYTEDFVINPEELELKPLDEIWKQIDS